MTNTPLKKKTPHCIFNEYSEKFPTRSVSWVGVVRVFKQYIPGTFSTVLSNIGQSINQSIMQSKSGNESTNRSTNQPIN